MREQVAVRQHQWVTMSITPIAVFEGTDGEPVAIVDPEKETNTQYGCFACDAPLTKETMNLECPGETDE
jgi:hypothetical protein